MKEPRLIRSPITREMLRPLERGCERVLIAGDLYDHEYSEVARLFEHQPSITLRVNSDQKTLDFLRYFPSLRRVEVAMPHLDDWEGLRFLPADAQHISLEETRRTLSLSVLERFSELKQLSLDGHTKDVSVLAQLTRLEVLVLRSVTLRDLSIVMGLQLLWSLDITLGGTKNLALLPRIESLKHLRLRRVRGLEDLTPIASTTSLQFLYLQDLPRVRTIPPLDSLINLRRVYVETLKGLTDVCAFAEAPALEEFAAVAVRHLEPENFRCFLGHPSLKYLSAGFGSHRKNDVLVAMFPKLGRGQLSPFKFV
jgi:hypothetical protein